MVHPPTTWPAACSPLAADLLRGDVREARVLAAFPTALYLHAGRHQDVLPVLAHDAVALPTGLCLPRRSCQIEWGVSVGDTALVGNGRVCLPGATVVAVRTLRPAPVRWGTQPGPAAYAWLLGEKASPALRDQAREVADAALAGAALRVGALLGAGQGLTPSGDDALCGVLLALRAVGATAAHRHLAEAVRGLMHATTSLSASLLLAAVEGYAVPDVVRLVALLTTAVPGPRGRDETAPPGEHGTVAGSSRPVDPSVGEALERVLAIGHSSGADLVAGLAGALLACHDHALEPFDTSRYQEGARRA